MTSFFESMGRLSAGLATCTLALALVAPAVLAQGQSHTAGHSHSNRAQAAGTVLPFDEKTWAQLLQHGPRPAAYVFTTSYCSTCPAAFAAVHQAVKNKKNKPELNAVVMDVSGAQAWRHAAHFEGMSRMYAFDGFEPAIRQAVDPTWPNVTPYVVLLDAKGQTQRVIGPPKAAVLQRWLSPS
jgi:hypothetical protein